MASTSTLSVAQKSAKCKVDKAAQAAKARVVYNGKPEQKRRALNKKKNDARARDPKPKPTVEELALKKEAQRLKKNEAQKHRDQAKTVTEKEEKAKKRQTKLAKDRQEVQEYDEANVDFLKLNHLDDKSMNQIKSLLPVYNVICIL